MKKKSLVPLLLFSVFSLIISCENDGSGAPYIERLTFDEKSEAEVAYHNSSVECEDKSNCPGFIGSIVLAEEVKNNLGVSYDVGFCSTQLISKNRVLTNRHCVPKSVAFAGAKCSKNLMALFPETVDHPAEKVRCKKVVSISKQYSQLLSVHPDWAIIELERDVNRPYPEMDFSGLYHNTDVSLYPTYFSMDSTELYEKNYTIGRGKIKKLNCSTAMNQIYSFGYLTPFSDIFGATCDDKVIGGNSGSGMYKSNNKLAAVVSFAANFESKFLAYGHSSARVKNHWAGGTNLSCIDALNPNRSSFCDFDKMDGLSKEALNFETSLFYASEVPLEVNDSLEKRLNEESKVQWEETDTESFLGTYGDEDSMHFLNELATESRNIVVPYIDQLEHRRVEKYLPYFPKCVVEKKLEDQNFVLNIPYITAEAGDVELSEVGRLSSPAELQNLSFEFRYEPEQNLYVGTMQRLPEKLKSRYLELSSDLEEKFNKCRALGVRPKSHSGECLSSKISLYAFKLFLRIHSDSRVLIENEEALGSYPRLEKINLPACQ